MPYSEPRMLCRELALSVIQDMPSTMMSEKTLPSVSALTLSFILSYRRKHCRCATYWETNLRKSSEWAIIYSITLLESGRSIM